MKLPCKEKYVDERVPDWVALRNADGTFDVCQSDDWENSIFRCLEENQAKYIVLLQNHFKINLVTYMTGHYPKFEKTPNET